MCGLRRVIPCAGKVRLPSPRPSAQSVAALGGLLAVLAFAAIGNSQRPEGDESPPRELAAAAEEFTRESRRTAAEYELILAVSPERTLELQSGSLLRWTNPLGGRQANGHVFLWTDRGRPEATASIYQFVGADGNVHEHHEFCSLSRDPLMARGARTWAPVEPGVELRPLPDAPLPAESRVRRLQQMRAMARKFTADKTTRDGVQRTLRLLPQPVYRYEGKHPGITDGALIAFVEATDPELFLWIEVGADDDAEWRYGVARMNSIQLRTFYDGALVWEAPTLAWRDALNRRDRPYTAFQIR
ncbi:MAG: hypothetical protein KY475_06985 [Planctomycetes bacterium]|nr:hypothetical protein [Planctomycetota bacterium]